MPDTLDKDKSTPTDNASNINEEIRASAFAQQADNERAAFIAQQLNSAQEQERNFRKNEKLGQLSSMANQASNINEGVGQSKFAKRAEKEKGKFSKRSQDNQGNREEPPTTDTNTAIGESFRYLGDGLHGKKNKSQLRDQAGHQARDIGNKISGHKSKKQAQGVISAQNASRNQGKNKSLLEAAKGLKEGVEMAKELGIKESSKAILNTLWSTVWEDPTLLSLLGLNAYMFASFMIPSLAQFGDDDLIGNALGGGRIAQSAEKMGINADNLRILPKIVEIILVVLADVIILGLIVLNFYMIYKLATIGSWSKLRILVNTAQGDIDEIFEIIFK